MPKRRRNALPGASPPATLCPDLPADILSMIALNLASHPRSLSAMAGVCRAWRDALHGPPADPAWRAAWIAAHGDAAAEHGYGPGGIVGVLATKHVRKLRAGWRVEMRSAAALRAGTMGKGGSARWEAHSKDVATVRLCEGREMLVTVAPTAGEVALWRVSTNALLARFTLPSVYVVGELPDSRIILVSNHPPFSRFFALSPTRCSLTELFAVQSSYLARGAACLRHLALSPPNSLLLARRGAPEILHFDLRSGELRARLRGHNAPVAALAPTPDGNVVSFSAAAEMVWWDVAGAAARAVRQTRVHVWAGRVAATAKGEVLVWDRRNTLWVVDGRTGVVLRFVDCNALEFLQVGNAGLYLTLNAAKAILLFYPNPLIVDVRSGHTVSLRIPTPSCAATSPDSNLLITGAEDGRVQVWSSEDGDMLCSAQTGSKVRSVWCAGETVVAGLASGEVVTWKFDF